MKAKKIWPGVCLAVLCSVSAPGHGQNLFGNVSGATPLQISAGNGIFRLCLTLPDLTKAGVTLASPEYDLDRRCSELVATTLADLKLPNAPNLQTDFNLGVSQAQVLADVQQLAGEELSTPGRLVTQAPAAQFSNISGRLDALRLGGFNAISHGPLADLDPTGPAAGFARSGVADSVVGPTPGSGYSTLTGSNYASSPPSGGLQPTAFYYAVDTAAQSGAATTDPSAPSRATGEASGGFGNHWGWFTQASANFGNRDQSTNEDAFDFRAQSVTAGIDYNFGSAVLGGSVGYDHYRASFDDNGSVSGGDVTVGAVSGSLYGAWFSDQFFVNGIVSYSQPKTTENRNSFYEAPAGSPCDKFDSLGCGANESLSGRPAGRYIATGATIGHDSIVHSWNFESSLSLSYRRVDIESFQETDNTPDGGLALAYDGQTIESLRSILGLDISRAISRSFGVVSPSLRLEWHHEFKNDERMLRAKFVEDTALNGGANNFDTCLSCFVIPSDPDNSNFGLAGLGVTMLFANRLQAYAYYETLIGATKLTSNAITLGIRGQF
jgi:outer membrane autotransporter protein